MADLFLLCQVVLRVLYNPHNIPDSDYRLLIDLMGFNEANQYIEKVDGNYGSVVRKIYRIQLINLYKKHPIKFILIASLILSYTAHYFWKSINF
ncbi:MAG: hypothetical protein RJQ09_04585 [Cyclobacteriaceae bacterium]